MQEKVEKYAKNIKITPERIIELKKWDLYQELASLKDEDGSYVFELSALKERFLLN
jgi:hypothetical protein